MKPKTGIPAIEGISIDDTNGTVIVDISAAQNVTIGDEAQNNPEGDATSLTVRGTLAVVGPFNETIAVASGNITLEVDPDGGGGSPEIAFQTTDNAGVLKVLMTGLPVADPHVAGQLWLNAHVLTVSAG